MQAADLRPVSAADRTQSAFDLFLIFAGANIVATTLQVGASLGGDLPVGQVIAVVGVGSVFGAWLVAALAPAGSRLGVPSIVATRAVLGFRGASLVAVLLYVTNFAWIALNNVIAASVVARALPGCHGCPGLERGARRAGDGRRGRRAAGRRAGGSHCGAPDARGRRPDDVGVPAAAVASRLGQRGLERAAT